MPSPHFFFLLSSWWFQVTALVFPEKPCIVMLESCIFTIKSSFCLAFLAKKQLSIFFEYYCVHLQRCLVLDHDVENLLVIDELYVSDSLSNVVVDASDSLSLVVVEIIYDSIFLYVVVCYWSWHLACHAGWLVFDSIN